MYWFLSLASILLILNFACSDSSEKQIEPNTGQGEESISMVNSNSLPKMLDLGSTTCIPCKKMAPILDSLDLIYVGKAEIIFIDIKENQKAARDYGVTMIPTQIFIDDRGKEVNRHVGFFSADSINARFTAMGIIN